MQPEFCNLTHLVKVDLSKNQLTYLPDDLGNLSSLQHLDLYNNKLSILPPSFSQLRVGTAVSWWWRLSGFKTRACDLVTPELKHFLSAPQSLKWLDLKDNPLDPDLAKAAGDCLDEKQCKQCASRVSTMRSSSATNPPCDVTAGFPLFFQVLQYMRTIQDEVDRAREKRLLKEKGLFYWR